MPRPSKAKLALESGEKSWKTVRITSDNWRQVLSQGANEAIRNGLQKAKWFGQAKIGIGVKRGLGEFAIEGRGDTNNFYFQMMNVSTDELKKLRDAAAELKQLREQNTFNIDARTVESGGSGDLSQGDHPGNQTQPALLASKSHQDV